MTHEKNTLSVDRDNAARISCGLAARVENIHCPIKIYFCSEIEKSRRNIMRIITISREFGSGGRELGKRLVEELGFAYYDKEILSMISE